MVEGAENIASRHPRRGNITTMPSYRETARGNFLRRYRGAGAINRRNFTRMRNAGEKMIFQS